ncbi:hypothetical protein [Hyalangium versicolor]|uniref:hypothetical protein n=1 Tax=Hyalangium versicolor TaxID=2861190 RepID=UPI001CCED8B0|nr:hypothetical protein [Hyalangium versicolor]
MGQTLTSSPMGTGDTEMWEHLSRLIVEARGGALLLRRGLVAALNERIQRLPSELGSDASASLLNRLLNEGCLEGLQDDTGQISTHVAARTLMGLGFPHALHVTPEQLEALHQQKLRPTRLSVPTVPIGLTLFATLLVHVSLLASGVDSRSSHTMAGLLAEMLGWLVVGSPSGGFDCLVGFSLPPPPPPAVDRYAGYMLWSLLVFFLARGVGRFSSVRPVGVIVLTSLSTMGLIIGLAESTGGTGWSSLVAAGGLAIVTVLLSRKAQPLFSDEEQ